MPCVCMRSGAAQWDQVLSTMGVFVVGSCGYSISQNLEKACREVYHAEAGEVACGGGSESRLSREYKEEDEAEAKGTRCFWILGFQKLRLGLPVVGLVEV
ncbi:hypothetical protein BT63DRAFT_455855 [Microthyrium microscopicum]|uniref:Uncharacterized protein n=1 Tax=Microthyrium microscopicum TaxID=703497 RepID=A0A6A6U8D1_9PEZI|nr:hypothetical protein BT63DRAFT_455855 [Microthyrium microscopicum]